MQSCCWCEAAHHAAGPTGKAGDHDVHRLREGCALEGLYAGDVAKDHLRALEFLCSITPP